MFVEGFERVAVDVPNSCLCQTGRIDSDSPASCGKGHWRGTCLGSALLRSKNDGTELLLRLLVENDKEISFQADINRSSKAKTWS